MSFFSGAVSCALIMPWVRRGCLKMGLIDNPGHRKIHTSPVPLAGGPALFLSVMAVIVYAGVLSMIMNAGENSLWQKMQYAWSVRKGQAALILAGGFLLLIMGILDDRSAMKAGVKLAFQFTAALLVSLAGVRITIFLDYVWMHHLITVFWIVFLVNAFNFIDNMNGASAGLAWIAIISCSWAGHLSGQYLVPSFGFLVAGSITGFLPYNFPKGRVFLGDSGSHLIGYFVAVTTILATYYSGQISNHKWAVISPLLFVSIPVIDLVQVVVYRLIHGKPVWIGDTNHLTHRLAKTALNKPGAVLLLWVLALAIACVPFLLLNSGTP